MRARRNPDFAARPTLLRAHDADRADEYALCSAPRAEGPPASAGGTLVLAVLEDAVGMFQRFAVAAETSHGPGISL